RDLQVRYADVRTVVRATGAHGDIVDDGHVLSDVLPLGRLFERQLANVSLRIEAGSDVDDFTEIQRLVGVLQVQAVIAGEHLATVDRPALGRCPLQYVTSGGAEFAHGIETVTRAAGSVRVLTIDARRVVLLGVAGSLPDFYAIPIGLEFVRENHGHARTDALAHLRSAAGQGDGAVAIDADEDV